MIGIAIWVLLSVSCIVCAFRAPATFLRSAAWGVVGLLILVLIEVATGISQAAGLPGLEQVHVLAAILLTIWLWITFPIALSTTIERCARLQRWGNVWHIAPGVVAVVLCFFATRSGNLGPSALDEDKLSPDAFRIVHMILLPILLTLVLVWWWLILQRHLNAFAQATPEKKQEPPQV